MSLWKTFRSHHLISGDVVDLKLETHHIRTRYHPYDAYDFGIYLHHGGVRVGYCDLRVGMNEELYYAGNVGYRIDVDYRGHGYAAEACRLLFPIAHERYGMDELIITCSPENRASDATLRKVGCTFVECVDVPEWHWLYRRGERRKNIYRFTFAVKDEGK